MIYQEDLTRIPQDDSTSWGEKMLLYWMVRELRPTTIVETGTHKGATTQFLAHACMDNNKGKVITCDPNDWLAETYVARPQLKERIEFRRCRGDELDIEDVDFAFVDGLHETEEVVKEFEHLLPRLNEGAVVVFHDCWPSPHPEKADVNSALVDYPTVWLPTSHALRIYTHGKVYQKPQDWSLGGIYD